MNFKKYSSIENSYRINVMNQIYEQGMEQLDWVVTEKVHGSNFSFYLSDEGISCAKRTSFLRIGDNFFNWQVLRDHYTDHLRLLYELCDTLIRDTVEECEGEIDGGVEVILYGEMFGGIYPHEHVEKDPTAVRVQRGIYYAPWNDFYAFDLKINGRFVHYDIFQELMTNCGFHYAEPLYRGKLDECLKYPNDFQTKLPQKLGLPDIEDNITEGVVIKPTSPTYFRFGERVILKNKNEKFTEKSHVKMPKEKPNFSLQETEVPLFEDGLKLINENRLRNVLSKIGPVDDKMFGKVQGMFTQDILTDWRKENEESLSLLEKKRVRVIEKNLNINAIELVRKHFVNIIDGTF